MRLLSSGLSGDIVLPITIQALSKVVFARDGTPVRCKGPHSGKSTILSNWMEVHMSSRKGDRETERPALPFRDLPRYYRYEAVYILV